MNTSLLTVILIILLLLPYAYSDDRLTYLAFLLKQKALISKNIHEILNINNNLQLNLKISSSQDYQEKLLGTAIRDQSLIIIDSISHTFIPINKKNGNCSNDTSSNQIDKQLNKIRAQLQKIEPNINSQMPCERNDLIKRNYLFYNTIYDGLNAQVNNQCYSIPSSQTSKDIPFLAIQNSKFVPNLSTNLPWVYGQITPQQLNNKNTELITLYGANPCPQSTPFLDDANNCFACLNNTVYDISLKKCTICDNRTSYNKIIHACTSSIPFNSNLTTNLNFMGTTPPFNPQIDTCPPDKPFFNNKSCISCSLPSYFSFTSNTCQTCPAGQVFDIRSSSCSAASFFLSNLNDTKRYIGTPLSPLPYENIKTCPSDHPFSNGKQCMSCGIFQFFNFQKMACQTCPKQYHFDVNSHSCASFTAKTINSNLISNRNFIGKVPVYNNLFQSCNQTAPFFNGSSCTSCTFPNYFNFDLLTCSSCNDGLTFNIVIQACEYVKQDFYTNIDAKNIYYNGDFQKIKELVNNNKEENKNMKGCPDDTPYYDSRNNSCIKCQKQKPLFDFKNNECMSCPLGSEFEEESHICLTKSLSATIQRMIMNTS